MKAKKIPAQKKRMPTKKEVWGLVNIIVDVVQKQIGHQMCDDAFKAKMERERGVVMINMFIKAHAKEEK
jgi:hypothetical protein